MIRVRVRLGKEGITSYRSQGHARSRGQAGLTLCNGLSAIEYQFLYAVKGLCPLLDSGDGSSKTTIDFKVEKGDFRVNLKGVPESEEIQIYQILSRTLMIGLEMLKRHHPKEMNIEVIRI